MKLQPTRPVTHAVARLGFYLALATPILVLPQPALAQSDTETKTIEYAGMNWRIQAQEAEVTQHMGREALSLLKGRLWADEANFGDGVISFDAAYHEHQVFVGAGWRADTVSTQEEIYFRAHLNNKPDALQYTPVENRQSAWQLYSDLNALAPVSQRFDAWNKVKIVVEGNKADIYFNSESPVLHIPDLKTDQLSGAISLRATGRESEPVYFSNVVVRPLNIGEGVIGTPKAVPEPPQGLIETWQVSSSFSESKVKDSLVLTPAHSDNLTWSTLSVDTSGIANIAKTTPRTRQADTVFIRMNIDADKAQMKEMTFGYSDRVRIYLNGKRLYSGNAGWRTKDYRFLGTVGFFDSVGLDLNTGNNELLISVSETFGGWGWAGAIENQNGITLVN